MIILGIETSCDETAAAILSFDFAQDYKKNKRIQILSNIVASSASLQAKYGGIIPEQAAREQVRSIIPVIEEALGQAAKTCEVKSEDLAGRLDAIAVTYGPGLIGSLLVGVETAKTLAKIWKKPLIPVNHLIGHFYANWIAQSHLRGEVTAVIPRAHLGGEIPGFPCIGLLVSGGHTDLVLFTDHGKYKYLGSTRDDAAGECFDKCARLLGLSYPGGPEISKLASQGDALRFNLPRPMIDSNNFDFSFSGLKTAVANLLHTWEVKSEAELRNLSASIEAAIVDVLVDKTIKAAQKFKINQIMIAGGVAANQELVNRLQVTADSMNMKLHAPPAKLCTDNGAMIAAAAFFQKSLKNPLKLQADPALTL